MFTHERRKFRYIVCAKAQLADLARLEIVLYIAGIHLVIRHIILVAHIKPKCKKRKNSPRNAH